MVFRPNITRLDDDVKMTLIEVDILSALEADKAAFAKRIEELEGMLKRFIKYPERGLEWFRVRDEATALLEEKEPSHEGY